MEEKPVCVLELKPGEKGEICGIYKKRIKETLGLHEGQVIEVGENRGRGPVILKVENGTKFILGRGQASSIFVKKIDK